MTAVEITLNLDFRCSCKRGSEWGGPLVGCRLKFTYFVASRLKFSLFVGSGLNFLIFVGCRKISVNKKKRMLIINMFMYFTQFQDFDP